MTTHKGEHRQTLRLMNLKATLVAVGTSCGLFCLIALIDHLGGGLPYLPLWLLGATTVSLVVGVSTGLTAGRRAGKAVKRIVKQADDFSRGDYTLVFDAEGSPTEFDELAVALNTITRSTRSAISELKTEEQRQRQFISDVSHEIRTPLTGIRGNAETLLDAEMDPEMRERFVDIIMGECDRLTRLANDLLTLQRVESVDVVLERINPREIAEKVCDMLAPLFEQRSISVTVRGEAPDVLGDGDQITQVIVNLLENATRFARSQVWVDLEGLDEQSVIKVTDDGPGFGDVDPTRLFDRFYRADKSRASATGGTGLGLAIVKSIVEAHDGTVEAFNSPSGGACFAVGIPSVAPR